MKKCIFLLMFFLYTGITYSQSLSVFDIDTTNFPIMKAKFFALDKDGKQIRPNASDFSITENGLPRTVLNVTCPSPKPQVPLSSVLVFDVSGSMSGSPLDMEKDVANSWINMLPLGNSDCAITSFSDNNYINQDFTTNKNKLVNAINGLTIISGTDYNAAMIDPAAGGILMAKIGKHKRIIIFLTDGQPNFEPRTQEIIDEAINNGITIYCLSINMPAHHTMIDFSNQTGGLYFENIKSKEQAEDALRKIFVLAQNSDLCEIEWQSGISCQAGLVNVEAKLNSLNLNANLSYQSPNSSIAKLEFSPSYLTFKNAEPGKKIDAKLKIKAINSDFKVINITSSNPAFTISNTNFELLKNQSLDLTISFVPIDSGYAFSKFALETSICPSIFYVSGGFIGYKPKIPTLKLIKPNGGEEFVVGSDTLITWEGIPSTDSVNLDYSIDNGIIWKLIKNNVTGLNYKWKNIPKPESKLCKVRVKQLSVPDTSENPNFLRYTLSAHTSPVYDVNWSPDGNRVVTASLDGTAIIWDALNGQILHRLIGHSDLVSHASWSPDGSRVATTSNDRSVIIWDAATGSKIHTLVDHTDIVCKASWSPDGGSIATVSEDNTAIIWDATTGANLYTLKGHTSWVVDVNWSPDGSKISTASFDETAIIWNASTGKKLNTLNANCGYVTNAVWSPDGSRIATLSYDSTTIIWDALTGIKVQILKSPVYTLSWSPDGSRIATGCEDGNTTIFDAINGNKIHLLIGHTDMVMYVSWSPDGSQVATASYDKTAKIWDASSGNLLHTLISHTDGVRIANWNPDGNRIVTSSHDNTAKIWSFENSNIALQEDISDSVFSIVAPQASANNIDMKECLLGMVKDSVITDIIENIGTYPVRIDSIYFTGDSSNFRLLSHILPISIKPKGKISLEFGFGPSRVGLHSADMIIITQSDTLFKKIIGTGYQPQLAVNTKIIDFGQIEIGNERTFTDTALVKNISISPITINKVTQMGPDKKQFEILSNLSSFTLQPNEERKLTLKFKPIFGGRTTGQIAFEYNGVGSPAIVGLFGTGIGGNLRISNDSAYPGETRNLKLIMEKVKPEGMSAIAPNFEATIRYQNTIIAPLNNPNWTISNDSTYLTIKGKFGTSNEIAQIPVVIGLGSVEETAIDIVNFVLKDDAGNIVDYDFESESGTFNILGICPEGGNRLINPDGEEVVLKIAPNPSDGKLSVEMNLIEKGSTSLTIYDNIGNSVFEKNFESFRGKLELNIETSKFSTGLYFVSLKTPTIRKMEELIILK